MADIKGALRRLKTRRANRPVEVVPARSTPAPRLAVIPLVLVVMGIIAVAFRGSWGAMRDAALACHFDRSSADLYPFAVDGLLVVAILAAVLLRHDRGARRYTLSIILSYTGASWLINFLHGLGTFTVNPATGTRPVPDWPVVVVVASLVIGSIFLGSHLLVYVWRHLFPDAAPEPVAAEVYQAGTEQGDDGTDVPEPPANIIEAAKAAFRHSLTPGMERLSQQKLMDRFRVTKREAAQIQSDVVRPVWDEQAVEEAREWSRETAAQLEQSPNGQHAEGS